MTKRRTALLGTVATLFAGSALWAQSGNPGSVNFLEYAQSSFDAYTEAPTTSQQQWMRQELSRMVVWSPYFDTRTSWFPNANFYQDLYAIYPGTAVQYTNPEWILKDGYGNWLYIPFACSGGTCSQYAADIGNPAFRAWWISQAQDAFNRGNYAGMFVDDVNMNFNVSDGNGNLVAPIDSNTGQTMTYTAWRSYVATFTQQIRAAFPSKSIIHNSIWYAGPAGVLDADPYIQSEIAAANTINMERGIASDGGLTGGTGPWSVYALFAFVDRVHASAAGKGVNFGEYTVTPVQQMYGLAGYFLLSNGNDYVSDLTVTPDNWFNGYDVTLGTPLGARTYNNGVFQRNFTGGIVLLGEPGLATQTIQLGGSFQVLNGGTVTSVTLSGSQGIILLGNTNGTVSGTPPPPPPTGVTRYLSDITPNYSVNGYGAVQINKSTGGTPLSIDGVKYAHGLGVNAYSEQHWALWKNCTSFTATVGVDSVVPSTLGHIDFQVWGDSTLLYDSGYMHGWSPAGSVKVNLVGYQTLSLVVTNGTYMAPAWTTYNDNGDWGNPVVVCNN